MSRQYHVVRSTDFDEFIHEVNRLTQGGWEAQGGISTMRVWITQPMQADPSQLELFEIPKDINQTKIMYCQAVVTELYDDEDDDEDD